MTNTVGALFVDSWRKVVEENGNEFTVFKILLRSEDNSEWNIERRYSEFSNFHTQIVCLELDISKDQIYKLQSLFPGKNPFSRQNESFLSSRARALDAYLQHFKLYLGRRNWNHPEVVKFFQIPERKPASKLDRISTPQPQEWMELMGKAERLFHVLQKDHNFCGDLDKVVQELADYVQRKDFKGDKRRFYDFKREFELFKIKNYLLDSSMKESFDISSASKNTVEVSSGSQQKHLSTAEDVNVEQKTQLRFQEAILADLEATVTEQKHLSMALAEEVDLHHRVLEEMQHKQEEAVETFQNSSARVRQLQ